LRGCANDLARVTVFQKKIKDNRKRKPEDEGNESCRVDDELLKTKTGKGSQYDRASQVFNGDRTEIRRPEEKDQVFDDDRQADGHKDLREDGRSDGRSNQKLVNNHSDDKENGDHNKDGEIGV